MDLPALLEHYPVQHFRDKLTALCAAQKDALHRSERLARETWMARKGQRLLPDTAYRQARYDDL